MFKPPGDEYAVRGLVATNINDIYRCHTLYTRHIAAIPEIKDLLSIKPGNKTEKPFPRGFVDKANLAGFVPANAQCLRTTSVITVFNERSKLF